MDSQLTFSGAGPRVQGSRAAQPEPVISANGIAIKPDYTLDDCPEPDIVCIPDFSLLPGAVAPPVSGRRHR